MRLQCDGRANKNGINCQRLLQIYFCRGCQRPRSFTMLGWLMITTCLYVSNADTTEDVAAACANAELNHGCSSFCGFVAYHCDSMQAFSSSYCADTMHRSLLTAAFNAKPQIPEWISLLRFVLDIPRSTKIVCIHVLLPHKQGHSQ